MAQMGFEERRSTTTRPQAHTPATEQAGAQPSLSAIDAFKVRGR